jgi:sec-independent protein translocase protein TatB
MGTPPPIQIATVGMWDTLILMVIALVVFGPRKLPQMGRQIGKLMYEFRKASNDFKFQMEEELRHSEEADRRKQEEERQRALALAAPAATEVVSQVSEDSSGALAAVPSATSEMESQYPEQTQDPAPAESKNETSAEETYPCIQPPSTGEQVPAARPTNSLAAKNPAQPDAAAEIKPEEINPEATVEENAGIEAALLPGADELRANESGLSPSGDPIPGTAQAAHHG